MYKCMYILYLQDLTYSNSGKTHDGEEMLIPEECISKISALLKVFTTVVRSLGEEFSPNRSELVTREHMTEVKLTVGW